MTVSLRPTTRTENGQVIINISRRWWEDYKEAHRLLKLSLTNAIAAL